MIDVTNGNLTKPLLKLAIPFIMAMLVETVMNLTNMFFVSRLGSEAIAAVAFCGTLLMLTATIIEGMSSAVLAIVSRRVGEGDRNGANEVTIHTIIICIVTSLIISIAGYYAAAPLMRLLGATPSVFQFGIHYTQISFLGIYSMFFLFTIQAIMRGAGEPIYPVAILASSALLNIILDPLLIFGIGPFPKLGVSGAAIATVLARTLASSAGLFILFKGKTYIKPTFANLKLKNDIFINIIRIAFPAMGRMSLTSISRIALMKIVSIFGTSAIAAYGISLRFDMVAFLPGLGFAAATSTVVGQNLGAKKPERAEEVTKIALYCNFIVAGFLAAVFLLFAGEIVSVFDKNTEVLSMGKMYIYIVAPTYLFMSARLVYNGSLRGAGDTFSSMIISLISLFVIQIPIAYILANYTPLSMNGVWISLASVNVFEAIMLGYWFRRGNWKTIIF